MSENDVTAMSFSSIDRRSGIAVWRQIADEIRSEISNGLLAEDDRLPPEVELAKKFAVNRHTVRAALGSLADEGIVESRQGQGTFVLKHARIVYPIGSRTRFTQGVSDQSGSAKSRLLSQHLENAGQEIADALELQPQTKVIRLETLSEADGIPLSRSTNWFGAERFEGIGKIFADYLSITKSLRRYGIEDYFRTKTFIEARHASVPDAADLKLSPGGVVLLTEYVNCDGEGNPFQFSKTRFAADRVSFTVGNQSLSRLD